MTGYPRRASLAGRCGIPSENDRIYVRVDMATESLSPTDRGEHPVRIWWPDGRSWNIESVYSVRSFGRAVFGNLCLKWTVCICRAPKVIWWENGRWFVAKRSGVAARP